jgi:hypothetical protein
MSFGAVRAALETAAMTITPALDTVFETGEFTLASGSPYEGEYVPVVGRAYQRLLMVPADPDNTEISANYGERGDFQISLYFPRFAGSKPVEDRVALIRALFYRGQSFSSGGITTTIQLTPAPAPAMADGDHHHVPVSIRYFAPVQL